MYSSFMDITLTRPFQNLPKPHPQINTTTQFTPQQYPYHSPTIDSNINVDRNSDVCDPNHPDPYTDVSGFYQAHPGYGFQKLYNLDPNAHNWISSASAIATPPNATTKQLISAYPNSTFWITPPIQLSKTVKWPKNHLKTKIVQPAWCEVCKLLCTSKDVLDQHKSGKKHRNNVQKLFTTGIAPAPNAFVANEIALTGPQTSPYMDQSGTQGWCDVCKTDCTTKDVLDQHRAGKKHSKNLKKQLANPNVDVSNALVTSDILVVGSRENPNKGQNDNGKRSGPIEKLEVKRRKVLEGGAALDSVKVCTLCNVVCNSHTVFNFHVNGQKHVAMLKARVGGGTGLSI